MSDLTKAQILAADDKPRETIEVAAWGGTITIRSLSGAEMARMLSEFDKAKKDTGSQYRLQITVVAWSIIDPATGTRLFADSEVNELAERSAAALKIVFDAAAAHNGITPEVQDEIAGN
jgi:hypothetical protein